ncbi:hypothetical protein EGK36_08810 [Klebsiella pneumoniae]|nr:hypothetical protein EGK36_08810 [Klebsiella pneumoniae]
MPGGGGAGPGLRMEMLLPTVGPRKRSAAGRQTVDTEPFMCRVAAAPDPAYASREPGQTAEP